MRFLKRKIPALCKEFEVLNRVPEDCGYENWYEKFLDNAEKTFRKEISRVPADDLSGDILDFYIDSVILRMQYAGEAHHIDNLSMILHHKGIVEGNKILGRGHLMNLRQDQSDLEQTLKFYRSKKNK